RALAQVRDRGDEVDLVVGVQRLQVADGCLRDHGVDPFALDHLTPAADRLAPELGDRDVEVVEVVAVEDDALRVAFVVADPQRMPEGAQTSYSLASSGSFLASSSASSTITLHCFQVAS